MRSTYSDTPYGRMRDRITKRKKKENLIAKRKEENYYAWLVTGSK